MIVSMSSTNWSNFFLQLKICCNPNGVNILRWARQTFFQHGQIRFRITTNQNLASTQFQTHFTLYQTNSMSFIENTTRKLWLKRIKLNFHRRMQKCFVYFMKCRIRAKKIIRKNLTCDGRKIHSKRKQSRTKIIREKTIVYFFKNNHMKQRWCSG